MILVVAAGLSAAVVWWAMSPPDARTRPRRRRAAGSSTEAKPTAEEADGFVLLPGAPRMVEEDRPPAAWSLLRIAIALALAIALVVGAVGLIGLFLKLQLDQYFATAV